MGEFRQVKDILHPEIIFEGSDLPEMKMVEYGNVLAQIIHFALFKTIHVFHLSHNILEVFIKAERFCLYKIAGEHKSICLKVQQAVER